MALATDELLAERFKSIVDIFLNWHTMAWQEGLDVHGFEALDGCEEVSHIAGSVPDPWCRAVDVTSYQRASLVKATMARRVSRRVDDLKISWHDITIPEHVVHLVRLDTKGHEEFLPLRAHGGILDAITFDELVEGTKSRSVQLVSPDLRPGFFLQGHVARGMVEVKVGADNGGNVPGVMPELC